GRNLSKRPYRRGSARAASARRSRPRAARGSRRGFAGGRRVHETAQIRTKEVRLPAAAGTIGGMARDTIGEFTRHRSQWLAAAIAYFTTFAIAPLIIIVVEVAGAILGSHRAVLEAIYGYAGANAGPDASRLLRSIVAATFSQHRSGVWAQVVTWAVLLASAFGWCGSIQEALNTIWDVKPTKRGLVETLKARAIPFAMMLGIAVL